MKCPFKIGDTVRFTPSERTKGLYQDIERFGLKVNEERQITNIKEDTYLYFQEAGGMPWNEFTLVRKG
jgi:hypothetical protein